MTDATKAVSASSSPKTLDDYPTITKRVVQHGLFWYFRPEEQVVNGEEKVLLVQHVAYAGDTVELVLNSDLERAERHGPLLSEEESNKRFEQQEVRLPDPDPDATVAPDSAAGDDEGEEVELKDLDDSELVDWLMSTGEFDGNKKPTAHEVVTAVGGDKDLAERVLRAENTATGDNPRSSVREPLSKVAEG
jgi:hypothetical protein